MPIAYSGKVVDWKKQFVKNKKNTIILTKDNIIKKGIKEIITKDYEDIYYQEDNYITKTFSKKKLSDIVKKMDDNDEFIVEVYSNWEN